MRNQRRGNNRKNSKNINIDKKIIIGLASIISVFLVIFMIQNMYTKIEIAKQKEKRQNMLNEIFVATDENKTSENKLSDEQTNSENTVIEETKKDTYLEISAVGDILCEESLYNDAYNATTKTYDFGHFFKNVETYTKNADIAIGTLETNFTKENYSGYKKYNSPKELAITLKDIGLDVLSTANNHSFDYGQDGIIETKEYLESLEFLAVGTVKNETDKRYIIKEVKGIKLAFLSYTYGLNIGSSNLVNMIDKQKILSDITLAKKEGAEYICTIMHWGDLTSNVANTYQKDLTNFLVENGVNLILGNHPAVLQPMEVRQNKNGENVFIVYSQGNFISASEYKNSSIEMILNIKLRKDGKTRKNSIK